MENEPLLRDDFDEVDEEEEAPGALDDEDDDGWADDLDDEPAGDDEDEL